MTPKLQPTRKEVEHLYSLYETVQESLERASELMVQAKKNKDFLITVPSAKDPKKNVEVKEEFVWQDIQAWGVESSYYKIMAEKYPDVFEAYRVQGEQAKMLQEYALKSFDIDINQIRISDVFRICEMVMGYLLPEKLKEIAGSVDAPVKDINDTPAVELKQE